MYKLITFEGGSQGLIKESNSPKLLKIMYTSRGFEVIEDVTETK